MGKCRYCGQDAGFLRSAHRECKERARQAYVQIRGISATVASRGGDLEATRKQIEACRTSGLLSFEETAAALSEGVLDAIEAILADRLLEENEEKNLTSFLASFGLESQLERPELRERLTKAAVLREVLTGKVPRRVIIDGSMPFNLKKGEELVWLFRDVALIEPKKRTHFEGGHGGFSVRIMPGVYYRTGRFRGRPVSVVANEVVDKGLMGVTTENLYYLGSRTARRTPYEKIIALTPYSDGISVFEERSPDKPRTYVTGDGWFAYNLVANLARIHPDNK
jgi:hypothetical protein